ncbi:MAG TPA: glycosyltransferase family 87 protein, partial [Terriglobia bacterium]
RGVFDGTRPVYGPASGLGWPMHYRYPPLFLLLFAPFAMLPLGWGAAVWVLLKVAVLVWLVRALQKAGVWPHNSSFIHVLPCLLFIAPYIVEEFRYGNAQFFVFALTAAGLLLAGAAPLPAAGSLALAISIKVWPLFFIPYLAAGRHWRVVSYTMIIVLALTFLPSFYFGVAGNVGLLHQWFTQEFHTQLNENEIWFPNQSLRGFLMRYLTVVDYSQVPDGNYPQVNITTVNPASIRLLWMIIAGTLYGGFLLLVFSRKNGPAPVDHALAFCLLALLEPFTQKYALAVLLWPALAAAAFMKDRRIRILIYCAAVLALIQPLAPGAATQRLLQVLGLDFGAATLLTAGLFIGRQTRSVTTV